MDWLTVIFVSALNIALFRFGVWYGFHRLTDGHDPEGDKWFDKATLRTLRLSSCRKLRATLGTLKDREPSGSSQKLEVHAPILVLAPNKPFHR